SEQIGAIGDFLKSLYPQYRLFFDSSYHLYGINRLNDLTSEGSHSYYHWRDFSLRFWCGFPTESEIIEMITIKGKRPDFFGSTEIYRRPNMFDVSEVTFVDGKTVNKCKLLVSTNINISSVITKPSPSIIESMGGRITVYEKMQPKFGVMIYDSKENISSAVIIPDSTEIYWDDYLGLVKVRQ
ncbi:MAG: hypothetical protein NZ903_02545, partial [Candidatus Micrarchaeota archaeon]|nr:hypothetical protein [Candidatus Micrarchaeota archaeon]